MLNSKEPKHLEKIASTIILESHLDWSNEYLDILKKLRRFLFANDF
jgi:hypothetical protein